MFLGLTSTKYRFSFMIICIYTWKHEIIRMLHMFQLNVSISMLVYECFMFMLILCKSSYARLTPEVLQPLPLIKISSRDLQDLPFLEKGGINFS